MKRVQRITGFLLALAFCTAVALPAPAAAASSPVDEAAEKAKSYLLKLDKERGPLSPWSYIALAASGQNLGGTRVKTAIERLGSEEQLAAGDTSVYCVLVLTLLAAGENPRDFRGKNLVAFLQAAQLPSGKFADRLKDGGEVLVNSHIWAVLALKAAGAPIPDPEGARRWLARQQHEDGSFCWDARDRKTPDVDTTGMALLALAALGETQESPVVQKGVRYLESVQLASGGFESWGAENPESCSTVILGLTAVGVDPRSPTFRKPGGDPVTALLRFQLPDGSFEHSQGGGPNEMATYQALLALSALRSPEALRAWLQPAAAPDQTEMVIRFWVGKRQYAMRRSGREEQHEMDAAPFIKGGRAFVPVRYLALALGVAESGIQFSPSARTVTLRKPEVTVTLAVGGTVMYVNENPRTMDVAPVVRNGRTYLPARYVAEALGYRADWNPSRKEVVVTPR